MPSKKRQFNVRPDEATWAEIDRAKKLAESAIGLELSQADLLRLAMVALSEKHDPEKPKGKK